MPKALTPSSRRSSWKRSSPSRSSAPTRDALLHFARAVAQSKLGHSSSVRSRHRCATRLHAGLVAAVVSGAPSTAIAFARGEDILEGARAAGTLLLPRETRTLPLLAAAVPVHLALSLGWALVLERVLPRAREPLDGRPRRTRDRRARPRRHRPPAAAHPRAAAAAPMGRPCCLRPHRRRRVLASSVAV